MARFYEIPLTCSDISTRPADQHMVLRGKRTAKMLAAASAVERASGRFCRPADATAQEPARTAKPARRRRSLSMGDILNAQTPKVVVLPPGLHLALRIDTGYRPAMVLEDSGGLTVKVRYTANGAIQERWVDRQRLLPPPWVGSRRP